MRLRLTPPKKVSDSWIFIGESYRSDIDIDVDLDQHGNWWWTKLSKRLAGMFISVKITREEEDGMFGNNVQFELRVKVYF